MELKDFINKVVISTYSKKRMYLYDITSPYFRTVTVDPDECGHHTYYIWPTINGDAFETGDLVFEEEGLNEKFKAVYDAYCHTKDAHWEEYGYWLRKD